MRTSYERIITVYSMLGTYIPTLDVDECATPDLNFCDENADCNNTIGSYICTCHSQYYGDGFECLGK